jgi:hypothetical protein
MNKVNEDKSDVNPSDIRNIFDSLQKNFDISIADQLLKYSSSSSYLELFTELSVLDHWSAELQKEQISQNLDLLLFFIHLHNNLLMHESYIVSDGWLDSLADLYIESIHSSLDLMLLTSSLTGMSRMLSRRITEHMIERSADIADILTILIKNSLDGKLLHECFRFLRVLIEGVHVHHRERADRLYESCDAHGLKILDVCSSFILESDSMNAIRSSAGGFELMSYVLQLSFLYQHDQLASDASSSSSLQDQLLSRCVAYAEFLSSVVMKELSSYSYEEKKIALESWEIISSIYLTIDAHAPAVKIEADFSISMLKDRKKVIISQRLVDEFYELLAESLLRHDVSCAESLAYSLLLLFSIDSSDNQLREIHFHAGVRSLLDTMSEESLRKYVAREANKLTTTRTLLRLLAAAAPADVPVSDTRPSILNQLQQLVNVFKS